MSTFVLIHGSWHGSWCWNKVAAFLERKGQTVFAPDLPGHGNDKTPIQDISLKSYVDTILRIVDSQDEPVVLVAHSRGGIVASQTAEIRPNKIREIVYLSAFLLKNGQSMIQLASKDIDSLLLPNLVFSDDRSFHFVKGNLKEIFYEDCSEEDASRAIKLLVPEPTAPIETPLKLGKDFYGIRRVYIECLRDKAVSPRLQQRMYSELPCHKVVSIESSHSPFFSRPDELANILMNNS
jgi:pimeloyl-ACP methyl ester carboxylesterase